MSFARAWTGFNLEQKRANNEASFNRNRIDPMKITAEWRDRFPKTNLYDGYIGDGYPLCSDLPDQVFLLAGAKYRLLGASPLPESVYDDPQWAYSGSAKRVILNEQGSGLYGALCVLSGGACSYPTVVVLDQDIDCAVSPDAPECVVDTIRVVKVNNMYYEYIKHVPCVDWAFAKNAVKVSAKAVWQTAFCANPDAPIASDACCPVTDSLRAQNAKRSCSYAGERMKFSTAEARCQEMGMELCDYRQLEDDASCPHVGYHWTPLSCNYQVKVSSSGQAAIIHDLERPNALVRDDTPSFFDVFWTGGSYPSLSNGCADGACQFFEDSCLCNVTIVEEPVFSGDDLPNTTEALINELFVGHADPNTYGEGSFVSQSAGDFVVHSLTEECCDKSTVFEVIDRNNMKQFYRNVASSVSIVGTDISFRNPPQFNSPLPSEFNAIDAHHETQAVLDHLLYHPNTAPFVAYRIIQRFGFSNPSPRYVKAVASAFRRGTFSESGTTFGNGEYGDLSATLAAALLDREARSLSLQHDRSTGSMREPILKVFSLLRSMEFERSVPVLELDHLDVKIGQMAFEQASVFSFFRPEYAPPGKAALSQFVMPESEVMSSTKVVGIMNGLNALVKWGLGRCEAGFGGWGCGDWNITSGDLEYLPDSERADDYLNNLSLLLTGGRLGAKKQSLLLRELRKETDFKEAIRYALQMIITSPEFHSTNRLDKEDDIAVDVPTEEFDYKAVIHLRFTGGLDSFNMLVPSENCPLYSEYTEVRDTIALDPMKLLDLDGDVEGQPCANFAVHHKLEFLKNVYDEGDALFVANMGVLTEPVNKTDYNEKTVTQLFAHNSMQEEVDALDPHDEQVGTGVLGRMAEVLEYLGRTTNKIAVETSPTNLASHDVRSPVFAIDSKGVRLMKDAEDLFEVIGELNSDEEDIGLYGETWSMLLENSVVNNKKLFRAIKRSRPTTPFRRTSLGRRFERVAQVIKARRRRGAERDFFTVPFHGFDTHTTAIGTLEWKFRILNDALEDLVTELKEQGIWDNVVIVQTSDFGRTLTPNSGQGSDHGWGGNYWVVGGGLKGKQVLGDYIPTFDPESEHTLGRGRVIPTTPFDSVFHGVAEWLGVTEKEMSFVLPSANKFSNLFTAEDLFEPTNTTNATID